MKKLLLFLIITLLTSFLFACTAKPEVSESVSENIDYTQKLNDARSLLEQEKYEDAYKLLYTIRKNEQAKKMLDDFKVFHTKELGTGQGKLTFNQLERIYTYDEKGNAVKLEECKNYSYNYVYVYSYDEKGQLLSYTRTRERENTVNEVITHEYEYNEHGDITKHTITEFGIPVYTEWEYEYDFDGKLISSTEVDGLTTTYQYDDNGNLIREITGNHYTNHTYDSEGKLVKTVFTAPNQDITNTYEYEYDEYGLLVKYSEKMYDSSFSVTKYSDYVFLYCPEE